MLLRSKWAYIALVIVAVANISTASILVRLAGVHGLVAATWRLILSSAITLVLLSLSSGRESLKALSTRDALLMTASGIALALHFGLWMMSLFHLTVAASVTIVDSYPALLAITGRYILGERYSRVQLTGSLIAMAGVAGLAVSSTRSALHPPGGDPIVGSILSLAGMVAVAVYFLIGKAMRAKYSTLTYTGIVYSIAALVAALLTKLSGYNITGYTLETYLYLLGLALLPMLGGHTIINFVLEKLSLLAATVPVLGEPVGAAILAWIILGEPTTPLEALWMAVTLTGIGMVLLGEK
ncbi:MAG: DMT family transporter [Desulfurococcales archaeon]|nr:DMT family transporter [Desulfurococcales archaeon]